MKTTIVSTTESTWRERVQQWRRSGQTAEAFVQGRDFAASTLRAWARKLPPAAAPPAAAPTAFVRVMPRTPEAPPTPARGWLLEVGPARLHVPHDADPARVAQLLLALAQEAR